MDKKEKILPTAVLLQNHPVEAGPTHLTYRKSTDGTAAIGEIRTPQTYRSPGLVAPVREEEPGYPPLAAELMVRTTELHIANRNLEEARQLADDLAAELEAIWQDYRTAETGRQLAEIKAGENYERAEQLEDELLRVAGETPSETCRRTHIQSCQFCDDVNCCDNTNPKYAKKVALLREIREKAAAIRKRKLEQEDK